MNQLEQIQERVAILTEKVQEYEKEVKSTHAFLAMEPTEANANQYAQASLRLSSAKLALESAQSILKKEQDWVNSSEYKNASKRMEALKKEADKRVEEVPAKVEELLMVLDGIQALADEHSRLATKQGGTPFKFKTAYVRARRLSTILGRWLDSWTAWKLGNPPANPVKHNYTREQEKAMKERYKPANELNAMLARQWAKEHPGDDDLD